MDVVEGDDGRHRCSWGNQPADYRDYHDTEWAFGETTDSRLFEKLCLEGFQAGLSWLTILRKRDRFREVFAGFEPAAVARFDDGDVARLLSDAGIVRHEGKIRSTINNAARALEMIDEHGSLAACFWPHAAFGDPPPDEIPATTETSTMLSKRLKRSGWTFVGPTTMYAFMQAMGLVNDHLAACHVRERAESSRRAAAASIGCGP
ncbi:MAG: DNA-3-methyladenine glycosylase I [Ilumatobacter sp.]|nr:DNA-3-methyladenine glycosylase I [Ilumatobacter sp.]